MKRRIGILVDRQVWNALRSMRSTGNEKIGLYNQAAQRLGLQPFYMTLTKIGRSQATGLIRSGSRYKRVRRTVPNVIHNRTIVSHSGLSRKLKQLAKRRLLFNRQNRYSKYRIHKLLMKSKSAWYRMPLTIRLSRQALSEAMGQKLPLYIKPMKGSIGEGIFRLSYRGQGRWKLQSGAKKIRYGSAKRTIERIMKLAGKTKYLVQEAIALAQYDGRPYDLRVTVQRGERGSWQVTGIFGKVAAPGRHVTNVAKGGSVKRIKTLFRASGFYPDEMERMITQASLDIAEYLGQKLTGLADIGLDLGIDQSGKIYFIEMNGRDQRIGFKKAGMKETFYRSYETPLRYARYLLDESDNTVGLRASGRSRGGRRIRRHSQIGKE